MNKNSLIEYANVSYFNFTNDNSNKASIYIFENNAKLCLSNQEGFATYCIGPIYLIFIEYIKNWFNCPIEIHLGYSENHSDMEDFIYTYCIKGNFKFIYENELQ